MRRIRKDQDYSQEYSSVVKHLPSLCGALGLILVLKEK